VSIREQLEQLKADDERSVEVAGFAEKIGRIWGVLSVFPIPKNNAMFVYISRMPGVDVLALEELEKEAESLGLKIILDTMP